MLHIDVEKGVYPYEYMTSWDSFNETQLPEKDMFYSNLYMEGITDDDYKHAQNVWKTFNIADMGMYHDLYMDSDVLLLTDVFENFRDTCLNIYKLGYMTSWDSFNETQLPEKDVFYSNLYMEGITDDDYKHAQNVWKTFNIADMGMYHDLYMDSDVLLLTDVFENFRDTCLNIYKLGPAHFITAPGLAWCASLKYTKVMLELLTDIC